MPDEDHAETPAESLDFHPVNEEKISVRRRRQERTVVKPGGLLSLLGGFKGIFLVVFAIVFYFAYHAWQDHLQQNKQERMEQLGNEEPVEPWFGK